MSTIKLLCLLSFVPGILCWYSPYFDDATGSAVGHASAVRGNAASHGETRTDAFGDSFSNADAHASGIMPVADSIANSASGGFFRWKRFATSDGTAIGTASAAEGVSKSHGSTTTTGGVSRSDATGFANGLDPTATAIVTSHSNRKRRGVPHGAPFPIPGFLGHASGTAIGTANAAQGRSNSFGHTHTAGGMSDSDAGSFAEGLNPSSTSIATSESNRRKRSYPFYYPGNYGGQSVGNAEGFAKALEGRSDSSGNTFTSGGNSASNSRGFSVGVQPVAKTIANSASNGFWKRDVATTNDQKGGAATTNDEKVNTSRTGKDNTALGGGVGDTGVLTTGQLNQADGSKFVFAQSDFSSNSNAANSISAASSSA